jgi:hypothetical protein
MAVRPFFLSGVGKRWFRPPGNRRFCGFPVGLYYPPSCIEFDGGLSAVKSVSRGNRFE